MPISVTVKPDPKSVMLDLSRSIRDLTSMARAAGRRAQELVRENFLLMQAQGNKQGWPEVGFYADARRSTHDPVDAGAGKVMIEIDKVGVALRRFGGTVLAKDKKLTLPATAEAYGRTAPQFSGLRVSCRMTQDGRLIAVLEAAEDVSIRGRKKYPGEKPESGKVMYWLKDETHHQPDEKVLPSDDMLSQAAQEGIDTWLEAQLRLNRGPTS